MLWSLDLVHLHMCRHHSIPIFSAVAYCMCIPFVVLLLSTHFLDSGDSPNFPLVVHQPASLSNLYLSGADIANPDLFVCGSRA